MFDLDSTVFVAHDSLMTKQHVAKSVHTHCKLSRLALRCQPCLHEGEHSGPLYGDRDAEMVVYFHSMLSHDLLCPVPLAKDAVRVCVCVCVGVGGGGGGRA